MWYKIYIFGKLKIILILNEIIFLYYFKVVIQSLGILGKVRYVTRQNKTIKK
jgi:hypothetical protein